MTIPAVTALASLTALGVGYVIAHQRITYWKQWGRSVFDEFHDNLLDRLDVEPDLTELAP